MTQRELTPTCHCNAAASPAASCCRPSSDNPADLACSPKIPWIIGSVPFAGGEVAKVSTDLRSADHWGAWKVRWAIDRMDYRVPAGLYAVGNPTSDSPALVSGNYKLSFDRLRSQLGGLDAWILVLDTQGVNVWCAAGKGTFGTDELARRIEQFKLVEALSHRTVIVPQLAAPGVAAHEVRKRTGVQVVYGPVNAKDIPAFLNAGMKATREMRRVRFPLRDRIALVPVEWVTKVKWPLWVAVPLFLLSGVGLDGYSVSRLVDIGVPTAVMVLAATCLSMAIGPALLPWLPGRPFSIKGFWVGLAILLAYLSFGWFAPAMYQNFASTVAWCLLVPAAASLSVMAFTGASTYTSLSGVRRETRFALPIQLCALVAGLIAWAIGRFA